MKLIPRSNFPNARTGAIAARFALDHPTLGDRTLSVVVYAHIDPADPFGAPIELDPLLGFESEEEMHDHPKLAAIRGHGLLKMTSNRSSGAQPVLKPESE